MTYIPSFELRFFFSLKCFFFKSAFLHPQQRKRKTKKKQKEKNSTKWERDGLKKTERIERERERERQAKGKGCKGSLPAGRKKQKSRVYKFHYSTLFHDYIFDSMRVLTKKKNALLRMMVKKSIKLNTGYSCLTIPPPPSQVTYMYEGICTCYCLTYFISYTTKTLITRNLSFSFFFHWKKYNSDKFIFS